MKFIDCLNLMINHYYKIYNIDFIVNFYFVLTHYQYKKLNFELIVGSYKIYRFYYFHL